MLALIDLTNSQNLCNSYLVLIVIIQKYENKSDKYNKYFI